MGLKFSDGCRAFTVPAEFRMAAIIARNRRKLPLKLDSLSCFEPGDSQASLKPRGIFCAWLRASA